MLWIFFLVTKKTTYYIIDHHIRPKKLPSKKPTRIKYIMKSAGVCMHTALQAAH